MTCPWCSRPLPQGLDGTQIDHIIPVAFGGPDAEWNLQLLHGPCNRAKGTGYTAAAFALAESQGINLFALALEPFLPGITERLSRR